MNRKELQNIARTRGIAPGNRKKQELINLLFGSEDEMIRWIRDENDRRDREKEEKRKESDRKDRMYDENKELIEFLKEFLEEHIREIAREEAENAIKSDRWESRSYDY